MREVRTFRSLADDFYPQNQDYHLPEDYRWIDPAPLHRVLSAVVYALAVVFASVYCPLILHARYHGTKILRKEKRGFFLYCNHTQSVGDVFLPALACFPKRIYTVVSQQNYALPVIGKILPYLGALPLGENLTQMRKANNAISTRIAQKHPVVVFPEAHVWDYCTFIRPFSAGAFKYPTREDVPAYCMTVTYQKHRFFKRPVMHIYVDGPFHGEEEGSAKERADSLRSKIEETMHTRARMSNYNYIIYQKKDE